MSATGEKKQNWKGRCAKIVKKSYNDITFWNKSSKLLNDACEISFNNPTGLPVTMGQDIDKFIVPGIMKFNLHMSFGISKGKNSEVNTMMRSLYSYVRHKNSGSKNYEAADYMTYILAMASPYAWYTEMCRLYGLFTVFSRVNRYIRRGVIEALGYDYDDIEANLASLRAYINSYAVKLNTFSVPKDLSIYKNVVANNQHIFKDSNDDKAQLYILQYGTYWRWASTTEGGSSLTPTKPSFNGMTLGEIKAFGDDLLNVLLESEDIGIMSGDTMKAFGIEKCHVINGIDPNYATIPTFNEGALAKIHNLNIVGTPNLSTDRYTQTDGYLIYDPTFDETPEASRRIRYLLDAGMDNPSPEFIMETTRFIATFDETNTSALKLLAVGTEYVTDAKIYTFNSSGNLQWITISSTVNQMESGDIPQVVLEPLLDINKFDWAPRMMLLIDDKLLIGGEMFNYTTVTADTIQKIHNAALLSALFIEGIHTNLD